MLLKHVELDGRRVADVRVADGRIVEIADSLTPRRGEDELDGAGGALLPGLHDHHVHLLALAAARHSVDCGPPTVTDPAALAAALGRAADRARAGAWVRGVGYHEVVAGALDRVRLDEMVADRPVRVQHRSGALWVLNSAGARAVGLPADHDGRLLRGDEWLRERLPSEPPPLGPVGRELAGYGLTGVTDATATNDQRDLDLFATANRDGELPQQVVLMGGERLTTGPLKVVLDDADLPPLDALIGDIARAHAADRTVAVHCVTRAELVLALAALDDAGTRPGDRIEHAGVAPPDVVEHLAGLDLTVVTQPNFVAERGDEYVRDVEPEDQPWLYRLAALLAAGVRVGGGTDAPFGHPDPWRAMRAAVERRTPSGGLLGANERVSPERALALFTTPFADPGGEPRRVEVDEEADLCLLHGPWRTARHELTSELVRMTMRAGKILCSRQAPGH